MTSTPSRGEARGVGARTQTTVTLSLGGFQSIALTRALRSIRAVLRQAEVVGGEVKFEKREPSPLLTSAGPRELADEITHAASTTIASHPSKTAEIERVARASLALAHARTALDALRAYHDVVDLPDGGSGVDAVHFSADRLRVYVIVSALGDTEGDYLASMSALFGEARAARRQLNASEYAALDVADWRLRAGVPFRTSFSCLSTSGFRAVQTWLSLADPGPDHSRITAVDGELLRGLIAHVEHIDRDMISDKEKIEPYRLPAAWHAAAGAPARRRGRPVHRVRRASGLREPRRRRRHLRAGLRDGPLEDGDRPGRAARRRRPPRQPDARPRPSPPRPPPPRSRRAHRRVGARRSARAPRRRHRSRAPRRRSAEPARSH